MAAREFYIERLNFNLDWEHRLSPNAPVYMQISFHGLVLHLSQNQRFPNVCFVFVETSGIEKLYDYWQNRGVQKCLTPPSVTPWSTLQVELVDPFGNVIRFNQSTA